MPRFPPPLPSLPSPTQELNLRQLSVPTNTPAGMVPSNTRDVQSESKTWGQTSCFISQPCPGRQTHYTQHATPSRHWDLHLASLQELGIWLVVSLWHTAARWKSMEPPLLSPTSLIPHITDLLFPYYFELCPNNILRLGDTTVSWAHLCMREEKRSQQIKSVPWLLTWLV